MESRGLILRVLADLLPHLGVMFLDHLLERQVLGFDAHLAQRDGEPAQLEQLVHRLAQGALVCNRSKNNSISIKICEIRRKKTVRKA